MNNYCSQGSHQQVESNGPTANEATVTSCYSTVRAGELGLNVRVHGPNYTISVSIKESRVFF